MTSPRAWDRAAVLPAPAGIRRRPEIVALPPGLPAIDDLFSFARDAELRFDTLKLRLEERTLGSRGERLVVVDLALVHPGHARMLTSEPSLGTAANYEIWLSDGETVRTYAPRHRQATERPIRNRPRGLDQKDVPSTSKVYQPLTALAADSLPETLIHPAGYCQNVLATGRCWISGSDVVAGREAIILECDHPRTIEISADRPDFHVQVAFDREDGIITRLTETIGGVVTREATVVAYEPNLTLPAGTFELSLPDGTTLLY